MNIYSKKNTKVTVTENSLRNGYDSVEEHARRFLKIGEIYTIDHTDIDGYNTSVYLKEFPNETFNSVSFK